MTGKKVLGMTQKQVLVINVLYLFSIQALGFSIFFDLLQ
jgi:hypothetical protein